ncbi:hypothetical protein [Hydrocarboniphaga sp.]|uniref:hypothetical protein n=1 Tax=Hydrocarboniphaga sp. TaxID=2033016 RepID=UPI003D104A13
MPVESNIAEVQAGMDRRAAEIIIAAKLALTEAVTEMRKRMIDLVVARYNLRRTYVAEQFELDKAREVDGVLQADVGVRHRNIQLRRFDLQQLTVNGRPGVSVEVLAAGSRKIVRQGFLVELRRGKVDGGQGEGIAVPVDRSDKRWGRPYKIAYGPSPSQLIRRLRDHQQAELDDIASERLQIRIGRVVGAWGGAW